MKNKLYNYLKNNNVDIEKDVFDYGFALFYSYSIYILFIIPISIFNDSIIEVFLFILLYIPIRKNIGGLHLKNQYHCIILSIIVTLLTPYIRKYIPVNYYFATFIIVLNFLLYNRFVPVDCKEKQLSDDEQKVYFPGIEMPGINPILKFLTDNLDNPDTKEYLDFLPALNNKDWHHTLHAITDNILRAIMFPKLGSTYIIKGMLLELFDYLADPTHFHFTPVHVEADNDFILFSHICHLLEDTDGRISRSELEQILNYSGNYLNTIVKKYTHKCLFDYGQTFCMKKAATLLKETTSSISEIMEELHFTNTTHFYKCFKEHYHMTPNQFRISSKNKH